MLKKIGKPTPPNGLRLQFFRAPIYLYRFKLGFLLGERFVLLKHRGRVTGELRETVIEVIDQDRTQGKIYSASGFGEQSQWFKNLSVNPNVLMTLKNEEFEAQARVLPERQSEVVLLRYARAHPRSIKSVARLSGYELDGGESDVVAFSKVIRIIEFTKRQS